MADGPVIPAVHRWPMEIAWERVRLTSFRTRDLDEFNEVRAANATWLREWDATTPPDSEPGPRSQAAWARGLMRSGRRREMLSFAVRYLDGGRWRFAGQVTVSGIAFGAARWAMIGYWIDQRLAGRGIIPAAVALAVDYCFATLRLHRIEIAIRPENAKSLLHAD